MVKINLKKTDRTSRQTQAGIGHSAPAHRGGHMQNRISRRQPWYPGLRQVADMHRLGIWQCAPRAVNNERVTVNTPTLS